MTECTSLRAWLDLYCAARDIRPATRRYYEYAVNKIEAWAGAPLTLCEACRLLNEYIAWRCENDASRFTARTHRGALGVLLREADRQGLCELPKRLRSVKLPDLDPVGFMPEELTALMMHADIFQRAMLSLGFDTGLRHGNLVRVRWPEVDESRLIVRVVQRKTQRIIVAPISSETIEACVRLRPKAQPGDDRLIPLPYCREVFYRRWRTLGERAGVNVYRRCLQATRRTASTLIAKKHGEAAAAAFLGHSAASGLQVFLRFYRVGRLLDERPPAPERPF